jgi:hypothetical protein
MKQYVVTTSTDHTSSNTTASALFIVLIIFVACALVALFACAQTPTVVYAPAPRKRVSFREDEESPPPRREIREIKLGED